MAKTVKGAYSEILRLRNEFYQKWKEVPQYDENRDAYKAKYEAFDKALELLTPSIVDPQPKDPGKLTHSVTKISDQDETVSDDLRKFAEEWDESLYRSDAVIAGAKWHKQQMMKDFPIWKRSGKLIEGALLDRGILYIPRYMIELSELKKLPKED